MHQVTGEPRELSLAGDVTAAEDAVWYSDASALHRNLWEGLVCCGVQNWTLACALHAIGKCKLVLFICRLMRLVEG